MKIGEFTGKVIETGIRTTRIRADEGEINIVPNGSITTVTNYSRGNMLSKVEVQIPYEEDIAKAIEVITTVCEELTVEFADIIIEAPQVLA